MLSNSKYLNFIFQVFLYIALINKVKTERT